MQESSAERNLKEGARGISSTLQVSGVEIWRRIPPKWKESLQEQNPRATERKEARAVLLWSSRPRA
jgi:hypothetical protein